MKKIFGGTLVVAFGIACLAPATTTADTVKIGSNLSAWNLDALTGGAGTGIQISQAGGTSPYSLTSPANGTVTGWAVRAGTMGATYSLRIMRPNGGAGFTGTATVPAPTAVPAGVPAPGAIYDYPASVAIQKGDSIGVDAGGVAGGLPARNVGTSPTDVVGYFNPSPADGVPTVFNTAGGNNYELQVQATVKFCNVPNAVGQTESAAVSAINTADCTSTVIKQQLKLKKIKKSFSKKKKKRIRAANNRLKAQNGIVLSQGAAAGTTQASPGPAVALTVGEAVQPPKKKKKKKKKK